MPDTITLPLSPREFWLLVLIAGLIAGSLLVVILMPTRCENRPKQNGLKDGDERASARAL